MRCYSRCCEVNECSCSNVEIQDEDNMQVIISEPHSHHHSHEPENNHDELDLRGGDPREHDLSRERGV